MRNRTPAEPVPAPWPRGTGARWSRRRFLGAAGAAAAATVLGACTGDDGAAPATTTTTTAPPPPGARLDPVDHGTPTGPPPFGLGLASGDPDDASVVLWTWVDRSADGPVPLTVEVALDDAFTAIVARTEVVADPAAGMTARTVVDGLAPDTVHWYRFALDGHVTTPARTRTAPRPGELPAAPLRVGHLSCQRWSSGWWTALEDVAREAPDLVVHCGDYVYEDDRGSLRPVDELPPTDLDGYRALWRRYKREPELQAAHAVGPWLVVWDDHEVEDGYQGDEPGDPPAGDAFLAQRAAAYRAWWEHTPTRLPPPDGPDLRVHRTVDWGGLARFVLLDTRQHRDPQPCRGTVSRDVGPRCDSTPAVSMLGDEQEAWLAGAATRHRAVWTSVVQQVVVHQWRLLPGNVAWNLDQWDGYTGARRRLLDVLAGAPAPVVLTGDVHSSWVAQLHADPDDDGSPRVGVELVAPGVSSDVPAQLRQARPIIEAQSPHVRWSEVTKRGWVLHEVDADRWVAAYRLVDDVSVPGAPVRVASRWAIDPRRREVVEA